MDVENRMLDLSLKARLVGSHSPEAWRQYRMQLKRLATELKATVQLSKVDRENTKQNDSSATRTVIAAPAQNSSGSGSPAWRLVGGTQGKLAPIADSSSPSSPRQAYKAEHLSADAALGTSTARDPPTAGTLTHHVDVSAIVSTGGAGDGPL